MPNSWSAPKVSWSRLLFKLLLIAFILGASFLAGVWFQQTFTIKKIILNKSFSFNQDLFKNKNLLFLNAPSAQKTLLALYPQLEKVTVKKIYPSTLELDLFWEKPLAQLHNNQEYLLLNENGKIISRQKKLTAELPLIKYFQPLRFFESQLGEELKQPEIRYGLKLLAKKNFPNTIWQIEINSVNSLKLKLSDAPWTIELNTQKEIAKIINIVQNINKTLKVKGLAAKNINLKYNKPIISL